MKKEDVETVKQMLRRFIDDVESGKAVEEAGWGETEHRIELLLKKLGLCEASIRRIRVSLHNPLPADILKTEEGDIFSDMQLAVKIRELIPKIEKDPSLQTGAEISGFGYMLDASEFPVLSHRLFHEGFSSVDEWNDSVSDATCLLTLLAAKRVWGVGSIEKALEPLRCSSLPALKTKKQGERKDAERVVKTLKWDEVLGIIDRNTCKIMGFLWYVDHLGICEGIRYPESMMLIQERAWKVIEKQMGKSIRELRYAVIEDIERIENKTADKGIGQDYAIVSWHEILRLPW